MNQSNLEYQLLILRNRPITSLNFEDIHHWNNIRFMMFIITKVQDGLSGCRMWFCLLQCCYLMVGCISDPQGNDELLSSDYQLQIIFTRHIYSSVKKTWLRYLPSLLRRTTPLRRLSGLHNSINLMLRIWQFCLSMKTNCQESKSSDTCMYGTNSHFQPQSTHPFWSNSQSHRLVSKFASRGFMIVS